jgi:hypothetical protein
VSGQLHVQAALPTGKRSKYPFDTRLGGPQIRSERQEGVKILDPTGTRNSDPSVVQPVASRYTDCAIPAPRRETVPAESVFARYFHVY